MKKIGKQLLSAVLLGIAVLLTACGGEEEVTSSLSVSAAEKADYTVTVQTIGGMPLEDIRVDIFADETKTDLVWAGETDGNGCVAFSAPQSERYIVTLQNVPSGYEVAETYRLTSVGMEIVLDTVFLVGDPSDTVLSLGDIVFDCTVTATDGTEYTFSELLQEKKAIVLNFWYTGCVPCRMEFPYLQEAYLAYSDEIALIAINPVDGTEEGIAAFAEELGLTLPMAVGDPAWATCMKLTAYPTTVIIDRYGMISLIHKQSITDTETFENVFAYFTSDTYTQSVIRNMTDMEQ